MQSGGQCDANLWLFLLSIALWPSMCFAKFWRIYFLIQSVKSWHDILHRHYWWMNFPFLDVLSRSLIVTMDSDTWPLPEKILFGTCTTLNLRRPWSAVALTSTLDIDIFLEPIFRHSGLCDWHGRNWTMHDAFRLRLYRQCNNIISGVGHFLPWHSRRTFPTWVGHFPTEEYILMCMCVCQQIPTSPSFCQIDYTNMRRVNVLNYACTWRSSSSSSLFVQNIT